MRRDYLYLLLTLGMILHSCSQPVKKPSGRSNEFQTRSDASTTSDKKLHLAWSDFRKAIKAKDISALRRLSTDCILCSDCLTNTAEEDAMIDKLKIDNPETWYGSIYDSLSFIPFNKFLKEEYPLVFDSLLRANMYVDALVSFYDSDHNLQRHLHSCIKFNLDLKNPKLREVLVQLSGPSLKHEGATAALAFIETKNTYLFCGYSTIP